MSHLYEMTQEYLKALDFLTDPNNEVDTQCAIDTIEALEGGMADKILNTARMIATLEAEAEAIKAVAKRQADRAKNVENRAQWLRDYAGARRARYPSGANAGCEVAS